MLRVSAFLLGIAAAACSGGPPRSGPQVSAPTPAPGPANILVERMLRALETEDVAAWRELLSTSMRARFAEDPAAIHEHLMSWRRDVLPLASALRDAELAIDSVDHDQVITYAADGRDAVALASVVVEGGSLHLDEN
ncbi:hypothetical protein BH11MYX3_BH11MYX3_06280 [soil metagenome]